MTEDNDTESKMRLIAQEEAKKRSEEIIVPRIDRALDAFERTNSELSETNNELKSTNASLQTQKERIQSLEHSRWTGRWIFGLISPAVIWMAVQSIWKTIKGG